jgi:hypothetical protein
VRSDSTAIIAGHRHCRRRRGPSDLSVFVCTLAEQKTEIYETPPALLLNSICERELLNFDTLYG